MALFSSAATDAKTVATGEMPPCDACGGTHWPKERLRRDGIDLLICVDFRHCIDRAVQAGRWQGAPR